MSKNKHHNGTVKPATAPTPTATPRRKWHLGWSAQMWSLVVLFALTWWWAAFWYGDVFVIAREHSFWAPDKVLMYFLEGKPGWMVWWVGRALLMVYRYAWLGGLMIAAMATLTTWSMLVIVKVIWMPTKTSWWKTLLRTAIAVAPTAAWMVWVAYKGFDAYFETENGRLLGVPAVVCAGVAVVATIVALATRKGNTPDDDEKGTKAAGIAVPLAMVAVVVMITAVWRPYVRVVTTMEKQMMVQDWEGMKETARAQAHLSYRVIAAYYAIALVQTNQQCTNLFDIRMDYDEPYLHGYNKTHNNGCNYYNETCDYYSGLIQTCIHHGMEQMTMNHPSIRTLKLLTKCALMRDEWEVVRKYLRVLKEVPFEDEFIEKYSAMVGRKDLVDADPEIHKIRLTEPIHDAIESQFSKPTFLGYNADLIEGRSVNALWNSLAVNIYSKRMDEFLMRLEPLQGQTLPQNVADAVICLSMKHPELQNQFPGMRFCKDRLTNFLREVKPYIKDRERYAEELFDRYPGYYGYYYFFGNLKATVKHDETPTSSNSGVN